MTLNEFRRLLRYWGEWHGRQGGYADHSALHNFRTGGGSLPVFGSSPPPGVEIPPILRPVVRALLTLGSERDRATDGLLCVYTYYLSGKPVATCARALEISPDEFRKRKDLGEGILLGYYLAIAGPVKSG
jgi:hypothetical protein